MSCNTLEELIDSYLEFLRHKGYSKSMLQIYEIPLRQLRDNCQWVEKDGVITLDITLFRHIISQSGKRAFKKKLNVIYLFVEYLKEKFNLNIELKGDSKEVNIKKEKSPKEIIDSFLVQEQILIGLFYGLNLKLKEISILKIGDIDLENGKIEMEDKEYNLYPQLKDNLEKVLVEKKSSTYLFEKDKKPLSVSSLRGMLQSLSKQVNIPQKDFRNSFKNLYL